MIDKCTGDKIEKMEVYVSVMVDVSGCKTAREAYRLSEQTANEMIGVLDDANIVVNDTYEVFRDKEDCIADEQDEE